MAEAGPPRVEATGVPGVNLHHQLSVLDPRGNLTVGEFGRDIPFEVRRYFLVHGVPSRETRGEHAHRRCHQFLVAVHGSVCVIADDGRSSHEVLLDRPSLGLHLPPMVWGVQHRYSPDGVLLVFASDHYDPADYIRSRSEFLVLAAQAAGR